MMAVAAYRAAVAAKPKAKITLRQGATAESFQLGPARGRTHCAHPFWSQASCWTGHSPIFWRYLIDIGLRLDSAS
jgi:hypothetical protein